MANIAGTLVNETDKELLARLATGQADNSNISQVKFEMQRRALDAQLDAQKEAAKASTRASEAAEKYTRATWMLIIVTAIGIALNTGFQVWTARHPAAAKVELIPSPQLDKLLTSRQQRLDSIPSSVKPDRQGTVGRVAAAKPEEAKAIR